MHYLAKLTPKEETATEHRNLVCLGCSQLICGATGFSNEDARMLTAAHYQRTDLTHDVGPAIDVADVVIAPRSETTNLFPISLIFVLRGA